MLSKIFPPWTDSLSWGHVVSPLSSVPVSSHIKMYVGHMTCLITHQDVSRTLVTQLWGSPTFCFSCNECTPEESPLIHYISAPGVSQCWINSVLMNWILTGLYLFDQFLFPKSTARLAWVSPERISLNRWNCPNFTASIKTSCWEIKP